MAIRHAPPRRIPTNEQALRQFRFLYTTRDAVSEALMECMG